MKGLNEFKIAFEQLLRFRLPLDSQKEEEEPTDYSLVPQLMPIVGLLTGIALYLAAFIILFLINNRGIAAVVAAAGIPLLQWWMYKGRNYTALHSLLINWQHHSESDTSETVPEKAYWTLTAFNIIIFLKILAIGIIVFFNFQLWLLIAPLLGATVYAEFMVQESREENSEKHIPVHWLIASVVTLLIAGWQNKLIAGLFVLVLAWLAAPYFNNAIAGKSQCKDETRFRAVMEIVEVTVLWIGLLALQ